MKKIISFYILFLSLFGCRQNPVTSDFPAVNLENLDKINCAVKLTDIADSIKYIILDTNGGCFLEGNCVICGATGEYFYLNSLNSIYKFDKDGKFIKTIGTKGRGPTEYLGIRSVRFSNSKLYVLTWAGEVVVYDEEGIFLDKILLPVGIVNSLGILNDSIYIAEEKVYTNDTMRLSLNIFNAKRRISQKVIQEDHAKVRRDFSNYGDFYRYGENIFYRNLYGDTIYRITREGEITPAKLLTYGKFTPNREMWENLNRRNEAVNAGYIFGQMYFEGGDYSFVWSVKYNQNYLTVYDKRRGQVIHNQPVPVHPLRTNSGIEDDMTNIGIFFWPCYVVDEGDKLLNLTNACNYPAKTLKEFQKSGIQVDENSNPVLTVCYLKKGIGR